MEFLKIRSSISPSQEELRASAGLCIGESSESKPTRLGPFTSKFSTATPTGVQHSSAFFRGTQLRKRNFRFPQPGLELRLNHPVRFQPYYSTRENADEPGSLVPLNERDFHRLPSLQTIAKLTGRRSDLGSDRLPVSLSAKMNELGLLRVACVSVDPRAEQSWPLEFNLRPPEMSKDPEKGVSVPISEIDADRLNAARDRITSSFSQPLNKRDKLSATNLLKSLEQILRMPKANWNWILIRELWTSLHAQVSSRKESIEHEETWLILAGFFLRPGFGAAWRCGPN